jgi:hypothetical protein
MRDCHCKELGCELSVIDCARTKMLLREVRLFYDLKREHCGKLESMAVSAG